MCVEGRGRERKGFKECLDTDEGRCLCLAEPRKRIFPVHSKSLFVRRTYAQSLFFANSLLGFLISLLLHRLMSWNLDSSGNCNVGLLYEDEEGLI